jgi:LacI family transcriptional regulator
MVVMAAGTTLHDVAKLAGVSSRTVSRVVNDEGGFNETTRRRVLDAIEKVGYRPNLLARALVTRRTGTVGLVVVDMTDPYFAELADGVQQAAHARGITMFIAQHKEDPRVAADVLDRLASFAVDGALVYTARGDLGAVMAHAAAGLNVVVMDQVVQAPGVASISSDILAGAQSAVLHLVDSGRGRIAMVGNSLSIQSPLPPRRESGYQRALALAGLDFDPRLIRRGEPTIEGGRSAMAELIREERFDAVFAYNDLVAIGAMQALHASRISIPDDVAVVGFDDIGLCEALDPPLTSVRIDRRRIGEAALDLLQTLNENRGTVTTPMVVPTQVIERRSSLARG